MATLTSCLFEHSNFTGGANCFSQPYGTGGWAWVTWTFGNRRASLARVRRDDEIEVALVPIMDTPANRNLIDGFLPGDADRITGVRAGMVPYSAVPYSSSHPTRHPPGRVLVDVSFRVRIDLPWYCFVGDTRATIHYYVHVFLDGSGRVRANVDGWSWNRTESAGVCGGGVADELDDSVPDGMAPLQRALDAQLGLLSGFRFDDLYFLPGDGRTSGRDDVAEVRNEAALILIP